MKTVSTRLVVAARPDPSGALVGARFAAAGGMDRLAYDGVPAPPAMKTAVLHGAVLQGSWPQGSLSYGAVLHGVAVQNTALHGEVSRGWDGPAVGAHGALR